MLVNRAQIAQAFAQYISIPQHHEQ